MKVPFVDLVSWAKPAREEYLAAFAQIIDTGAYVDGPQVADFEATFAKHAAAAHAIAVRTGTDALVLALRAVGVKPGDEVLTAANACFSTAEAISLAGATPVLCDVDDGTLLIDVEDAARRVTAKTTCIVPVHLFGQIADMDRVHALARGRNLRVVEDASHAYGATRGSWRPGFTADAAAFCFASHDLGAPGEGGAVTTQDAAVAERVRQLRDHGKAGHDEHVDIGHDARMPSLEAACLSIALKRVDAANEARRALAARYRAKLGGVKGVRLVDEAPGSEPAYHLMVVRVDAAKRDAVRDALAKAGISTGVHYPTPIHLQKAYESLGQGPGSCPVAEKAVKEMISLPMFPDLTVEQVDHVCDAFLSAL